MTSRAVELVDAALRAGISFCLDDDGHLLRWMPLADIDPGPEAAWHRLCVEFDRHRRAVQAELRRRLTRPGEFLMGTPTIEDGAPLVSKEQIERAWAMRTDAH
jgi:hypothetical protein